MDSLYADALATIFCHLPTLKDIDQAADVCQAWQRVADRVDVWTHRAHLLMPNGPKSFRMGAKHYVLNILKSKAPKEQHKLKPKRESVCTLFEREEELIIVYAKNTAKLAMGPVGGEEQLLSHAPGKITAITHINGQPAFGYDYGRISLWTGKETLLYDNHKTEVKQLFTLGNHLVARYDTATLTLDSTSWAGRLEGELNTSNSELAVIDGKLYAAYIPGGQAIPQIKELGEAGGPDTLKPMTQSRVAWVQRKGQTFVAIARKDKVVLYPFTEGRLGTGGEITFKPQSALCQGLQFLAQFDAIAWIGATGILQLIDLETKKSRDTQWPGVIKQLEVVSLPHPVLILKPDGQSTCLWDPSDELATRDLAPDGAKVVQHHDSALGPVFAAVSKQLISITA